MIFLNGQFLSSHDAQIPCTDRGLLLGDGLFETIKVANDKLIFLERHFNRFKAGAKFLQIPFSYDLAEFSKACKTLLALNTDRGGGAQFASDPYSRLEHQGLKFPK